MAIREWSIDGAIPFTVRLEHSYWSGRATITINGEERYRHGFRLLDFGLRQRFRIYDVEVEVCVTAGPLGSFRYELFGDGKPRVPVWVPAVRPWVYGGVLANCVFLLMFLFLPSYGEDPSVGTRIATRGMWMFAGIISIPTGVMAMVRLDQVRRTRLALLIALLTAPAGLSALALSLYGLCWALGMEWLF